MSTLLEKEIKVNRIVTTSTDDARAIEDPARAKIVEILYRQTMSAEQISAALKKHGYKKALTTVRHHLEILNLYFCSTNSPGVNQVDGLPPAHHMKTAAVLCKYVPDFF